MKLPVRAARTRLQAWLADRSHNALAQRMASNAFVIRVASAVLAFASQIILARWMGSSEFGIYVYVWTWVLILGEIVPLGLSIAAQRFIPEYTQQHALQELRGFLSGSRWLVFGMGTAAAAAGMLLIKLAQPVLSTEAVIPLYLACVALPFYALSEILEGIARSYNRVLLAMLPGDLLRPLSLVMLLAATYFAGFEVKAATGIMAAVAATWAMAMLQLLWLQRCLRTAVAPGPRKYEIKRWYATSIHIALVRAFSILLTADVVILQWFRPYHEVAFYYTAFKTVGLVAFIHFAVSAAAAHRYAEYHVRNDRARLERFVADAIAWTFWPSLLATIGILAVGRPALSLFGSEFTAAYPLMFILAVGLIARAAVGPAERLLIMLGEQRVCALLYAIALVVNLVIALALIPPFGAIGAAMATAAALSLESILLFQVIRRRVGLRSVVGITAAGYTGWPAWSKTGLSEQSRPSPAVRP